MKLHKDLREFIELLNSRRVEYLVDIEELEKLNQQTPPSS